MTSSRWSQIKEIAAAAVELDADARVRYLDKACPDAAAREEVESLLGYASEDFLETPIEIEESATLAPGHTLGSYDILAAIGAGGMGEVFRARDRTLGREVAIKILPTELSRVSERLERFEREARVLASLNHPGIATLHGLEKSDGVHYIVMELIDGETLEKRLEAGALPFDEALDLLRQIAEALEVAHDKGVIHRDLKPANIMVSPDGVVKILDFGLAKDAISASADSESPTRFRQGSGEAGSPHTAAGVILGTVGYMSPEQARGHAVDKRTDLWAFGCVAYEMLTGKPAFPGDELTDVIGSIMHSEPDWDALPAATPPKVRDLLKRCLRKESQRRMRDVGDAWLELEEASEEPFAGTTSVEPRSSRLAVPVLSALVIGLAVWSFLRPDAALNPQVTRTVIPFPAGAELAYRTSTALAIAPDGRHVAFAVKVDGRSELHLRALSQPDSRALASTSASDAGWMPFFSPDNQWLGFLEDGELKKVAVSGGAPVAIATIGPAHGASWGMDGTIVLARESSFGLSRVSADGGDVEALTEPDRGAREKAHRLPAFLPGGDAIVFTMASADIVSWDDADIAVLSLDDGSYRVVVEGGTNARFSETGHLIYARGGSLFTVPFDAGALEVTGPPQQVLDGVAMWSSTGNAEFAIARNGTLVFAPGTARDAHSRVVRVDRSGEAEAMIADTRSFSEARLSPDGRSLALEIGGANHGLWVYDIARTTLTRLALGFDNESPVWTPDANRVTFASNRNGRATNLFWLPADGSAPAEQLTTSDYPQIPGAWSPDGTALLFEENRPGSGWDLMAFAPTDESTRPFVESPSAERRPTFSPDGRLVAYESDASGQIEVYVRAFPSENDATQVSHGGGRSPIWSRDGDELFYRRDDRILSVDADSLTGEAVIVDAAVAAHRFDITPDGDSFVIVERHDAEAVPAHLNLVLNWSIELEQASRP